MALKAKSWMVLEDCLERGVEFGIRRLFKHREDATITEEELIGEAHRIVREQMAELDTYFREDEDGIADA